MTTTPEHNREIERINVQLSTKEDVYPDSSLNTGMRAGAHREAVRHYANRSKPSGWWQNERAPRSR